MIKIYLKFKAQYLKTQMEYKLNFCMLVFAGILMRTLMLGVAFVLFSNVPDIAGWMESEVYMMMSFFFLTEGVCNLLFDGTWSLGVLVFGGEFDIMLSRPVSLLYQVLSYDISLQGIGLLIVGFLSLGLSLRDLGYLRPGTVALCIPFIACGTVIRLSTNLIGASAVFWLGAGGQINVPYVLHSVGESAKYPVSIYPGWMRLILFFIVPFALIGYVPALILRGEHPLALFGLLAVFTTLYFLTARAVFYRGVRNYESMGM